MFCRGGRLWPALDRGFHTPGPPWDIWGGMNGGRLSGFTWERGPFSECPQCRKIAIGLLTVSGNHLTMRCSACRYSEDRLLPFLNKKTIYLDQFVFSMILNVESNGRLPLGHENFARDLQARLKRLVLLQQVVLPYSNIHRDETIVFHRAAELAQIMEFNGGGVKLIGTHELALMQVLQAAKAFLLDEALELNFSVDEIIRSPRNVWLPLGSGPIKSLAGMSLH